MLPGISEWEIVEHAKRAPKQDNLDDCGVFTAMTADCIVNDIVLRQWTVDEVNTYRKRICLALLRCSKITGDAMAAENDEAEVVVSSGAKPLLIEISDDDEEEVGRKAKKKKFSR